MLKIIFVKITSKLFDQQLFFSFIKVGFVVILEWMTTPTTPSAESAINKILSEDRVTEKKHKAAEELRGG